MQSVSGSSLYQDVGSNPDLQSGRISGQLERGRGERRKERDLFYFHQATTHIHCERAHNVRKLTHGEEGVAQRWQPDLKELQNAVRPDIWQQRRECKINTK